MAKFTFEEGSNTEIRIETGAKHSIGPAVTLKLPSGDVDVWEDGTVQVKFAHSGTIHEFDIFSAAMNEEPV